MNKLYETRNRVYHGLKTGLVIGLASLAGSGCANPLVSPSDVRVKDEFSLKLGENKSFGVGGYIYNSKLDSVYPSEEGKPSADITINGQKTPFTMGQVELVRLIKGNVQPHGDHDMFVVDAIHGADTESTLDDSVSAFIWEKY